MKLKELTEMKNSIVADMKALTENVENFKIEDFQAKEVELADVENKIKAIEKVEKITQVENTKEVENMELKNAILEGKEIKLANEHTTKTDGDLIQTTYANAIEKKLVEESPLYAMARKIVTNSPHIIPVQAGKIGKFVKTAELGEYVAQKSNFATVELGAEKFTNMITISDEMLQDNDYNLEQELIEQLVEALGETLNELMITGDGTIEGLNVFATHKVEQGATGVITAEEIVDVFFALKKAYRKDAVWIMNDATCKAITKLVDGQGRPLLVESYNDEAFGASYRLLGRPVVVADEVDGLDAGAGKKSIFFVNLDKALVVGLRKDMTIKKSEEYGFINDSVAIKSSVRLDIKKLLEEACAFLACK